jgi:hypothetical protein
MAGRYRALLIGNSSYPADEHNLQTLKGPVKDIAVLNRALIDPGSGLFADADVTLLPEATSTRAIRALGRFFGTADRDDLLLVYFSGHGKLDPSGRLHLCMQDTDSTDLLSTALSSARINEFAEASRARNVVIVLDCCYAGAFRGGDLGETVAGPGRYVLTSCRGTQLANDATMENGTSFFTQHLVDGLLQDAADHDGDGYITFSDLYAYVDRRLREAGKQIPQRRVVGDGDVRLAKREPVPGRPAEIEPVPAAAGATGAGTTGAGAAGATAAGATAAGTTAAGTKAAGVKAAGVKAAGATATGAKAAGTAGGPRRGNARRRVLVAAAVATVAIAGGVIAAVVLLPGGSGQNPGTSGHNYTSPNSYTASAPWRLKIADEGYGDGCSLTLIDAGSGAQTQLGEGIYGISTFQISSTGAFRWRVNDPRCNVVALPGTGTETLPFAIDQGDPGDTGVFRAPARVAVRVKDWHGNSSCDFRLYDPATGTEIDFATATQGQNSDVTLDSNGRKTVYLALEHCGVGVSAAR